MGAGTSEGREVTPTPEHGAAPAGLLHELESQLRSGRPGFRDILDSLVEAVTIRDAGHRIVYANRAALGRMGFASLEELQRRGPNSIIEDYIVVDEHGRELTMADIPSVRLLSGEPAEPLVMRTVHRKSGVVRWDLLKSSVLRDDACDRLRALNTPAVR